MSGPARVLALLVRLYRAAVSPLLPARCRFAPTCSSYALTALHRHGAARGSWLTVRRLARCHPFHPGGHDPVPPARSRSSDDADSVAVPVSARPVSARPVSERPVGRPSSRPHAPGASS